MYRLVLTVAVVVCWATAAGAADTKAAAATRTKKLQVKVTVMFDDTSLKDALEELKTQVEASDVGSISWKLEAGVSINLKITYKAKDKPLAEVLAGMFEKNGLGYVVVSNEKDRLDGWVQIKPGKERGYAEGEEPAKGKPAAKEKPLPKEKPAAKEKEKEKEKEKPADDGDAAEKAAARRLENAKELLKAGKKAKAKEYCEEVLKSYPKTKAADEARELLDKLK